MTEPTPEQQAILDQVAFGPPNVQIIAYAGCGKTTTLELIDDVLPTAPRLIVAFNKRIADVLQKRMAPTTECRTLNSLGYRVWNKTITDRIAVDPKKTLNAFKSYIADKSPGDRSYLWSFYDDIRAAVDMAKAVGYIPIGAPHNERSLTHAREFFEGMFPYLTAQARIAVDELLYDSIRLAYKGVLDFNDQLYMPALFGGMFPKFPVTMIDEDQDLSPINHEMVRKLVGKDRRLIAVGDPYQSIYGFRGALTDGMSRQRAQFSMLSLPLSLSFRCPEQIVENARWRAPNFRWLNPGGRVETLEILSIPDIPDGSAVLCRNNAPLFKFAIRCLSHGRAVSMAGTDIGPRLISTLRRLGDGEMLRPQVLSAIDAWEHARPDSPSAKDMADSLRLFASLGLNLDSAVAHAEHVLRQDGRIFLSTGHKSKGLEWPTVYHLDPWLIGDGDQELNLRYVIQTRSSDAYFEINSDQIA